MNNLLDLTCPIMSGAIIVVGPLWMIAASLGTIANLLARIAVALEKRG